MVAPFPLTNAALAEVEFNKIDFIQLPFIPKYLLIIKVSLDWNRTCIRLKYKIRG